LALFVNYGLQVAGWGLFREKKFPFVQVRDKRLLSRGKKPRSIFLREEGSEPDLEKNRTVRSRL
jgi:hypothetical protein